MRLEPSSAETYCDMGTARLELGELEAALKKAAASSLGEKKLKGELEACVQAHNARYSEMLQQQLAEAEAESAAVISHAEVLLFRAAHWPVPRYILNLIPFKFATYSRFGHALLPTHHDVGDLAWWLHALLTPLKWQIGRAHV